MGNKDLHYLSTVREEIDLTMVLSLKVMGTRNLIWIRLRVPRIDSSVRRLEAQNGVMESWANCVNEQGTKQRWSFLLLLQGEVYLRRVSYLGSQSTFKGLLEVRTLIRTTRTFCHISCRPTHFHLGVKKNTTVCRSKAIPNCSPPSVLSDLHGW